MGWNNYLIREQKVAIRAIAYVKRRAARDNIKVHNGKPRSGYDLVFVHPGGKKERIEVKGSEKDDMIPDMRVSEFDGSKRLKADFLYFVGNVFKLVVAGEVSFDQSALTGESLPVTTHQSGILYSSSIIKRGEAKALVLKLNRL